MYTLNLNAFKYTRSHNYIKYYKDEWIVKNADKRNSPLLFVLICNPLVKFQLERKIKE